MLLGCFARYISIQCRHCQFPAVQEVCDSNLNPKSSMCLIENICLMRPLNIHSNQIHRQLQNYIHVAARGE